MMWNNDLFVKYRVPKNKLQVVKRVCTIEQKQYSNARYSWLPNIAISLPKVFTEVCNPEKRTIIIYDVRFWSIFLKKWLKKCQKVLPNVENGCTANWICTNFQNLVHCIFGSYSCCKKDVRRKIYWDDCAYF